MLWWRVDVHSMEVAVLALDVHVTRALVDVVNLCELPVAARLVQGWFAPVRWNPVHCLSNI